MFGIDHIILLGAALILTSILLAKAFDNLGLPTLVLFLGIGMLAGSEGPGGIFFDDARMAQSIGVVALTYILFAGGLETQWTAVRPVLWQGVSLATLGVVITAGSVGLFTHVVLGMPLLQALLLGAVISSTDAAAVFSVLRTSGATLRGKIRSLLELESGSNDPMAVFLTIGVIELITTPEKGAGSIALLFLLHMGIGGIFGYVFGRGVVIIANNLRLRYDGIYPVFFLAYSAFTYGITAFAGGSGFLAVYIAGMVAGNLEFIHKRSVIRFFDGLAWLCQIAMFLTLGLLVFPTHLMAVIVSGLAISFFLIFVGRPLSVFVGLAGTDLSWREKGFIAWVGLRGAVPIVLATFPLLAGIHQAETLFNLVFFIVLTSALLQGWSLPSAARLFGVDAPLPAQRPMLIEFDSGAGIDADLVDLTVPIGSSVAGKAIVELGLPEQSLVVLVGRHDQYFVPTGGTVINEGDVLLMLVQKNSLAEVRNLLQSTGEHDT